MSTTDAPSTSAPSTDYTRTEVIFTPVLLRGCLPSLKPTTVARRNRDDQRSYETTYVRTVTTPRVETRLSARSFCNDGQGREEEVDVPRETFAAINRYVRSAREGWGPMIAVPAGALPQWRDPSAAFEHCTAQSQMRHLSLPREHTGRSYTNGDGGRGWPFTYRLYPDVQQYLDDGGVLFGPEDQPLKWEDYTDRLERAVESAKNLDELDTVPEGTVKIAFTTDIVQPTRLKRISRPEGEDDTNSLQTWKVLHPEISVKSRVQDDSPEWIKRDESAQASYDRSISAAIASSYLPLPSVPLTPQTSVLEFLVDTSRNEHLLFHHAAHNVAKEVSFEVGGKYTDEDGEEIVDGLLVKAAWVDPDMFKALCGEPPRDWRLPAERSWESREAIDEGLETMRKELAGGSSAGEDSAPEEVWGSWE
ncbi:hypothetical protein L202_03825 [Cryptococcus amylolentus CBS 6039]|uniref:Uncharacterized protein n=1 Tax=Cryptococcus amylolentus CBS 6039 TaxID=1295533 RepID=A0A1E3HUD7_9TREE|nr:hypothetical protein L202_03825 [Cryptococcus amylolentus CBS 6039]ODN79944.1 hypothetical protein L202_03825 [Cryptococcus amylolentus CBS 6039]